MPALHFASRKMPWLLCLVTLVLSFGVGCVSNGYNLSLSATQPLSRPAGGSAGADAVRAAPAAFPLAIASGKRYLEDASGRPFLIHGDTAWSLIAQLIREDVDRYLDDRRMRGFNAILVNLIEHRFSTRPPFNAYGEPPFRAAGDYTTPNDNYFLHVDWVLRRAGEKGFLVLLAPSYIGAGGGNEGWYEAMVANGPAQLREYGRYLGQRYRDFTNILWVHGGDYNPPNKELVGAIAEGIREFHRSALHTAHCGSGTAAVEYWLGEPWLTVNSVYTYEPIYAAALKQYARGERLPFFVLESAYENEHGASEQRLRMQAYQAVLSAAAGHIFGNNPIWHFDGPGIYPAPVTWQEAMQSPGAHSMTQLRKLFEGLSWWTLEPDVSHTLLSGDVGSGHERAVAAQAADASFAIAYVPDAREVTLNLGRLAGSRVRVRWYDPSTGQFSHVDGSPFPAVGLRRFRQDARNGSGFSDWVLLMQAQF
jgi:hypothetical protein